MWEYIVNMLSDYWFWGIAGFFIGGILAIANLVRNKCGFTSSIVAVTIGVYFGALGTRLLYVLIFHPHLLVENPLLAMAFWQETGTWLGGPLLGGLALALCFYILKEPVLTSLGSVAPGLALAHAIARIGCVVGGCCYGAPSTAWCAIYNKHLQTTVHPTAVYSMIGELINLAILQTLWTKPANRKYLFPLYLLILSIHRFFSDMFRGSEAGPELIPGLRIFQIICLFIFVFATSWLLIIRWKKKGLFAGVSLVGISLVAAFTIKFTFNNDNKIQIQQPFHSAYLVATRETFVDGLESWINNREQNGYEVTVHGWKYSPTAEEIRKWLELKKNQSKLPVRHILLVGDYAPEENKPADWYLPSIDYHDFITTETKAFTDVLFGDLNGDHVPDIPVGRLPVRNSGQLKTQLQKINAFQQRLFSPALYHANLWVGGLGFTKQINDIVLEQSHRIPSWINQTIISAHPQSSYAGHIPDQPAIFLNQIAQPFFLSLVASHGSYREIHQTVYEGRKINLTTDDVPRLNSLNPSGLTILLSCNTGQFNMPIASGLSFSESLANHAGGPVALVSATGTSHPLTNHYITESLLQLIPKQPETVGELLLGIHRQLAELGVDSFNRLIQTDKAAKSLVSAIPDRDKHTLFIPGLLKKNVLLYNLIGDPSVALNIPGNLQVSVQTATEDKLTISGSTETDCDELYIDLLPTRKEDNKQNSKAIAERRKTFNEVNSRPHFLHFQEISGTEFSVKVPIDKDLKQQEGILRVIAVGQEKNYVATTEF